VVVAVAVQAVLVKMELQQATETAEQDWPYQLLDLQ
jgi:hypothetical protein